MNTAKPKKGIRSIPVSEFKAQCLSLLTQVDKTKTPIRATKRGKPIAEIVPVNPQPDERDWIGSLSGQMKIVGDIVSPIIDLQDFEVSKIETTAGHSYLAMDSWRIRTTWATCASGIGKPGE